MKHIGIVYFVFAVAIMAYGITALVDGTGRLWANIGIVVIGLYFLYRGIATTVNNRIRRQRELEDKDNDPANA
jgi:hypothetical protein